MQTERITYLRWFDILIITAILWGEAIYTSSLSLMDLVQGVTTVEDNLAYTAADNYYSMAEQAGLLAASLLYLRLRRFDFSRWKIFFSWKALIFGGLLYIAGSLLYDAFCLSLDPMFEGVSYASPLHTVFSNERVSDVLYALLNGPYEELYFLGICLAVRREHLKFAIPFSLLIRVSFHTYQGMLSAVGIGIILGSFFLIAFYRTKDRNLLPFFIAHALTDIFGIGILTYYWPWP